MRLRALGYNPEVSLSGFNAKNIKLHNKLTNGHELIRRLLLGDSHIDKGNKIATKPLLHPSLVLIDLYEQVSAVHYDYLGMRKRLEGTGALALIEKCINLLATSVEDNTDVRDSFEHLITSLENLVSTSALNTGLLEGLMANLRSTALLVFRLLDGADSDSRIDAREFSQFLTEGRFSISKIKSHLHFGSPILRFALRMGLLMLATVFLIGYLPKGSYGYWLPLTMIVVSRPSYGLTLKRNIERLSGTLIGLCVGWLLLLLQLSTAVQLGLAIVFLFVFFAFFFARYLISTMGITLAVILCLSIYRGQAEHILLDRLLFTVLGCILGLLATFIFPIRLPLQLKTALKNSIATNLAY